MDDAQLQSIVHAEIADAVSYIDDDIGPDRAKALDYYFGRPFGDEEEGRSQVVSRDVHDMVQAALPSLMRIFFGAENVVEFEPHGPEDVEEAEQKTDYINHIVTVDNDGFRVFYAVIKDALRSKVGFVKSWWDSSDEVYTRRYTGLDEMGLTALVEELGGAKMVDVVEASNDEGLFDVKLKIRKPRDRVCIEAVPPEEFLIARNARDVDTASFVGHRCQRTISDLVAMGYDLEDVEQGASEDLDWNEERQARNPYVLEGDSRLDPMMREVLYVEAYIRTDYDGDGIAELRKVCCVGPSYKVIANEECDEQPFADFQCDPEPHTFFGESLADKVMDVQLIKSRLLRGGLDGLSLSLFPRTIVGPGGSVEDAMNTEVGAVLRAKNNTATDYVFQAAPNTAQAALPFMTYMDELRENRTGMSKVSMGLDAEALQNTTATAAEGNFTRSQERIELLARIMASGMRKLFRRIAYLVSENQRKERVVKLRNQWVPVDPRRWRTDMNVICNVGLGGGSPEQKIQTLSLIAGKQEAIMMQAGLDNPLVTPKQYYTTLSKLVQEAGFKNPDAFFSDPESEEVQARMANKQPAPDPKMVEVQAKMQLEAQKADMQAQADERRAMTDAELKRMELELRAHQIDAEMALKERQLVAELDLKERQLVAELELKSRLGAMNAAASVATSEVSVGGEPG